MTPRPTTRRAAEPRLTRGGIPLYDEDERDAEPEYERDTRCVACGTVLEEPEQCSACGLRS